MWETLKALAKSKKAVATIAGLAAYGFSRAGFNVPANDLMVPAGILVTYVLAQGVADHGKARETPAQRTARELKEVSDEANRDRASEK